MVSSLKGHSGQVTDMSLSPNEKYLVTCGEGKYCLQVSSILLRVAGILPLPPTRFLTPLAKTMSYWHHEQMGQESAHEPDAESLLDVTIYPSINQIMFDKKLKVPI